MISSPLFSIIVPVYNVKEYLSQCVESALIQPFKDFEVILVDDGSTDGSGKLCDELAIKDARIKVLHKQNSGLSDARNVGLLEARGGFLLYLDSDDFWNMDFLGEVKTIIENNKNVKVIMCRGFNCFINGKTIENNCKFETDMIRRKTGVQALEYILSVNIKPFWSACRQVFSRHYLIQNDFFFAKGLLSEDAELIPQVILFADNVDYYDETYYSYRINREGSIISTTSFKRINDYFNIVINWFSELDRKNCNNTLKTLLKSCFANIMLDYFLQIPLLKSAERDKIIILIQGNSYILNYVTTNRNKLILKSIKFIGIRMTLILLGFCHKVKKHLKRKIGE